MFEIAQFCLHIVLEHFMQKQQLRLVASLTLNLNYSFDLANNLNAILCGFETFCERERKLKLTTAVVWMNSGRDLEGIGIRKIKKSKKLTKFL